MEDNRLKMHRWLFHFDDQVYDFLVYDRRWRDVRWIDPLWEIVERLFEGLHRFLCSVLGHEVIDDHCGKPAHRFCVYCRKSFPYGMVDNKLTSRR